MKRTAMILRAVAYALLGTHIIVSGESAIERLHIVIGVVIFIESLEELVLEMIKKSYRDREHSLYHAFAFLILSVVIFFMKGDSIGYLCIMWGTIAIIDGAKELNEAIYEKAKGIHALKFCSSIIAIVFAILLVIDPFEHVRFHMILLAIEYFVECIMIFDRLSEDQKHLEEQKKSEKVAD